MLSKTYSSKLVRDRQRSLSRGSPQPPLPFFSLRDRLPNIFFTRSEAGNSVFALRADPKDVSALRRVDVSDAQLAFR